MTRRLKGPTTEWLSANRASMVFEGPALRRQSRGDQMVLIEDDRVWLRVRLDPEANPRPGGQGVVFRGWIEPLDRDRDESLPFHASLPRAIRMQPIRREPTAALASVWVAERATSHPGTVAPGVAKVEGSFYTEIDPRLLFGDDADQDADAGDIQPALERVWVEVMEWFEESLSDRMDCTPPEEPVWEPRETLKMLMPLLRAVQDCHEDNIVHGDIGPSNVMVADRGLVLIDWGIGQVAEKGAPNRGKIDEAPPEAITLDSQGRRILLPIADRTPAWDAWQLGVLICKLLLGADRRFDVGPKGVISPTGGDLATVLSPHGLGQLVGVIRGLLEIKPENRLATAKAVPAIETALARRRSQFALRVLSPARSRMGSRATIAATLAALVVGVLVGLTGVRVAGVERTRSQPPLQRVPASASRPVPLEGTVVARRLDQPRWVLDRDWSWAANLAVGDRVRLRLTVKNPTDATVKGVLFRLIVPDPDPWDDESSIENIEAQVSTLKADDEWLNLPEPGATSSAEDFSPPTRVWFSADEGDSCSVTSRFNPDRTSKTFFADGSGWSESESLDPPSDPTDAHIIWYEALGDIEPGETVKLTLDGKMKYPDPPRPDVESSQGSTKSNVQLSVEGGPWRGISAATTGDIVRVSTRLEDASCNRVRQPFRLRTEVRPNGKNVLLIESAVESGQYKKVVGRAELSIVDAAGGHLQPVPGSTRLIGNEAIENSFAPPTCSLKPVMLGTLSDGITQAGVLVKLAGYVPREPCDTHSRWVQSRFIVVEQ
jgi:serine/threonine protein kinase